MTNTKSDIQYILIDANNHGQRIDNFLFNKLKGVPKTRIYRMIRKGELRVNAKRVAANYRLCHGDKVRIPPLRLPATKADMPLLDKHHALLKQTIFEDENILAINKPPYIPVHGGTGLDGGVIEALRALRPELTFLELAHRLDRDTSGCLVLAKNRKTLQALHQCFRSKAAQKTYLALVMGQWPKHNRFIKAPLIKNRLQSGERMVKVDPGIGIAAETEFQVCQRFSCASLVEVKPKTGRTHQIRVHAKHAGHPIAADSKYGDPAFNRLLKSYGLRRLFLHALGLTLPLPIYAKPLKLNAPLPDDLQQVLAVLEKLGTKS